MNEIEIVNYQENWPNEFLTIAENIRLAIGDDALRIDHIGSTSVPGLAAKDIIDIQITVMDINSGSYLENLNNAGFRHIERVKNDLLIGLDDSSPELKKYF